MQSPHSALPPLSGMSRVNANRAAATLGVAMMMMMGPVSARACQVRDGAVASVAPAPFLPADKTVTLKASDKAEFRWDITDKMAIGWMRITNADGEEIGWVPAGDQSVSCGASD